VRYLLDTTLLIDHANGYPPATTLLERLYEQGAELLTCEVVVCEALSGGTVDQRAIIGRLVAPLEYVATDPSAARAAGEARRLRREAGGRLGLGDALIAAVAGAIGATIVTRNRPDFERQGASVLTY
jgi:predicted nucleic acid-binding protein